MLTPIHPTQAKSEAEITAQTPSAGQLLATALRTGAPLDPNDLQRALEAQHPEVAPYLTVTGSDKHQARMEALDALDRDWASALAHFEATRQVYVEMDGVPGGNTALALHVVFDPLQRRYDAGERSPDLFESMSSVE